MRGADVRGQAILDDGLSADEVRDFTAHGFTIVNRPVFTAAELDEVRDRMRAIFERRETIAEVLVHDLGDGSAHHRIDEIVWPSRLDAGLKRSAVFLRARRYAQLLLGAPVTFHFDHLIDKPPHSEGITQWHQDLAFEADPGEKVTIWVPLVDADEHNGCMQFVPLRGDELIEHQRVGRSGLGAVTPDLRGRVSAPVQLGGFTAHREITLHSTGPNHSDGPRPVWVLRFRRESRSPLRRLASEIVSGTSSLPPFHRVVRLHAAQGDYRSDDVTNP